MPGRNNRNCAAWKLGESAHGRCVSESTRRALNQAWPIARMISVSGLLALGIVTGLGRCESSGGTPEYAIKAAYLYRFAQFVEWQERNPRPSLTMCIYGRSPLSGFLDDAVRGKFIDGVPIQIRRVQEGAENWESCQLIFFGATSPARMRAALGVLRGQCVLTVGETRAFAESGGIITFFVEEQRFRFDIDLAAARESHIRISARLAALGRVVRSGK